MQLNITVQKITIKISNKDTLKIVILLLLIFLLIKIESLRCPAINISVITTDSL